MSNAEIHALRARLLVANKALEAEVYQRERYQKYAISLEGKLCKWERMPMWKRIIVAIKGEL